MIKNKKYNSEFQELIHYHRKQNTFKNYIL